MKSYLNLAFVFFFSSIVLAYSQDKDSHSNAAYKQYGTPFAKMPKREDAVIYQVNIRAFSQAGTLNAVTEKLSAIQQLGANVIYLMPIYPVGVLRSAGGLGSPYAVKDYKAVNPDFGTLEDLRTLVSEAHKKNMAVILDWVANHTAWDNQWISQHPEWYQQNVNGDIIIPPETQWKDVAQLNYDNTQMRNAMVDAMSYWVYSANIDGFRCDAADMVPENFWSEAISKIRKIKKSQHLLMMAEGSRTNHFDAGFDYTFGFGFFGALEKKFRENKPATTLQDANALEYANNYKNENRIVRYTTNHDVNLSDGTPLELFGGKKGSIAAFVVAAYMKSVPMIYNGQETGYARRLEYFNRTPIDWSTADPLILAEYKKIIAFRNSSNAIKKGVLNGYSSDAVSAFTMETETEKVLVLSNLTNATVNYIVPVPLAAAAWKDGFSGVSAALATEITLSPYQYLVFKN